MPTIELVCDVFDTMLFRVPSHFHLESIQRDGLFPEGLRLTVMPQSVDTERFKPPKRARKKHKTKEEQRVFKFLSVFKWEFRKGWDVLLEAFCREFDYIDDDVMLVIKTSGKTIL